MKLSQEQFDSAIRKGLGRAYLYVREHGDAEVRDILLNALTHNLVYDYQVDGSRADWLYSIIELTHNASFYENAIIEYLPDVESHRDADMILDLLKEYAKRGSDKARKAIYKTFDLQEYNEPWIGGEQITELDGIEGFLHVAEIIGARLRAEDDYWEHDGMLRDIEERFGKDGVAKILEERSGKSENLRTYLQKIIRYESKTPISSEQRAEDMRKKFPLEKILEDVKAGAGKYPYQYMTFGRYASDEDIAYIFERLLNEDKYPQLIRLLWIFRMRKMPKLNDKLLSYAIQDDDDDLRYAAISALSNITDNRIHELAYQLFRDKDWQKAASGLELLVSNYCQGDNKTIEDVLKRISKSADRDQIHSVIYDLKNICEMNNSNELTKILLWIYENSPCMLCRCKSIELLLDNQTLLDELLNECIYDGDEEIRKIASRVKNTNS